MSLSEERNRGLVFYLYLLLSIPLSVFSQCDKKGISTNPTAPVNPEATATDDGRLNNFDWRNLLYNINSSNTPSPIDAPFNQSNNTLVNYFLNNRDNSTEDGWEMIKHDMGFNYDGTPRVAVGTIFLVLYNRYQGTLRVFLQGNRNPAYNGAEITVYFLSGQKQSSILNSASKIWALDKFSQDSLKSVSPYNNDQGRWFYADFYMAYDPCTCFYESTLAIKTFLIAKSNIQLSGSLVGTITPLTSVSNNVGTVSDNKYSFDAKGLFNTAKKAMKIYNDFSSFASDQFNAIENEGKTNLRIKAEELFRKNSISQFQGAIKKNDFLKTGLKAAPYIGTAVDLVDFFVGGGKSAPQEVTIKPMAINATLDLKGTLTSTFEYNAITFYTPGSKNAHLKNVADYPKYNEVLGVFNLLSTPKGYTKRVTSFSSKTDWFTMAENIKYVLNPAAGYKPEDVDIQANLIFKQFNNGGTESLIAETGYLPISVINNFSSMFDATTGAWIPGYRAFDKVYLKLLVNLTRLDTDSNKQNTLFVLNYSVDLTENANVYFPTGLFTDAEKDVAYRGVFDSNWLLRGWRSASLLAQSTLTPNSKITAGYGFLNGSSYIPPALPSDVSSFCNTVYRDEPLRSLRNFRVSGKNDAQEGIESLVKMHLTAFPNPTTGNVSFHYYVEEPTQVRLNLINVTGSIVATPIDALQEAGPYEVAYDASGLAAGVYIYTLETNKGKETKRLVVIK